MLNIISKHWFDNFESIFIITDTSYYTYNDMFVRAGKTARFLKNQNLKDGDKLAICLNNSLQFADLYFGCLYSGIVPVPINPVLGEDYAMQIITDSEAKLFFTDLPFRSSITILNEINYDMDGPIPDIFDNIDENSELIIVYTSGTTDKPKGIVHTYKSLISNGLIFIRELGINEKNRFINYLPMSYLGGYYNLLILPFLAGASVVLDNAFNAGTILNFWNPIIKNNVNTLWFVPTIMAMLLEIDRGEDGRGYCINNDLLALVGTAPLYEDLKLAFEKKYHLTLYENYALSETLFITSNRPSKKICGVGKLLPNVSLKIIDNKGNTPLEGVEGELAVSTYSLMKGYFNHEPLQVEWFYTGDIGYMKDEYLYITGRKKDLIIRGGINISPASIEKIINTCEGVLRSCIVGIPNKIMGEEVICVITTADGYDFEEVKIKLHTLIKKKLPQIQQPTHILHLPLFPVTPSGKIQKNKIRQWAKKAVDVITANTYNSKSHQESDFYKPSHNVGNITQAISVKYNNMVYEMHSKGIDVKVLSLGEAFFNIPLFNFDKLPFPQLYHYSHSRGLLSLREKLSDFFQDHYEVNFSPENEIIITAGSKVAIYMVFMAILNAGDEVIIPEPAWVSYPEQVKLCSGVPVMIPFYENVFEFEKYITNRTKIIVINNPNNPSGKVYTLQEITHLTYLAEKYGLFVLSDEAYSEFLLTKDEFVSIGNIDKEKKYSIICNSMSKNYGMSGWRIGYIISNTKLIDELLKLNQHLITCPATVLQYYLSEYFYDVLKITEPQIKAVVEKRQHVIEYMNKIELKYLEGNSTFYIFASIEGSNKDSIEFCDTLLDEKHICAVPGIGYGPSCDGFIRLSVGAEPLDRIYRALDDIKLMIGSN